MSFGAKCTDFLFERRIIRKLSKTNNNTLDQCGKELDNCEQEREQMDAASTFREDVIVVVESKKNYEGIHKKRGNTWNQLENMISFWLQDGGREGRRKPNYNVTSNPKKARSAQKKHEKNK